MDGREKTQVPKSGRGTDRAREKEVKGRGKEREGKGEVRAGENGMTFANMQKTQGRNKGANMTFS
jgi:hypothetical protein